MILLLSDGSNSAGIDPATAAAQAKAEGVKVYTVAFGTPNGVISAGGLRTDLPRPAGPDRAQGRRLARPVASSSPPPTPTPCAASTRTSATRSGRTPEKQDVSYAFAGLGAVLLGAAGLLSMLWRGPLA